MRSQISAPRLPRILDTDMSAPPVALGLLALRLGAGGLIFYVHGWHKLVGGLAYLRDGTPWKLVEEVAEMPVPAPLAMAFLATAVQFVGALFLLAGYGTRIAGAALAAVLLGAVGQNILAQRDPQLAVLYTLVAATFALTGAGPHSVDGWCSRRRVGQPLRRSLARPL